MDKRTRSVLTFIAISAAFLPLPLNGQSRLLIADTYYADGDLKKPSAFTILKSDSLWLTKFDAAVWLQTGWNALVLDIGAATALGSARNEDTRIFYPLIAGGYHRLKVVASVCRWAGIPNLGGGHILAINLATFIMIPPSLKRLKASTLGAYLAQSKPCSE
jgi:hypothetical protein